MYFYVTRMSFIYVFIMNPLETSHHSNHYLPTRYVANGEDVKKKILTARDIDFFY